jgi:hypothetical protein
VLTINSLGAAQNVASVLAGVPADGERGTLALWFDAGGPVMQIVPGAAYTELRFPDCAVVTIHAPATGFAGAMKATVSWSSSSTPPRLSAAKRTARVIEFAADVAEQLNRWIDDGSLVVGERGVKVVPFPVGSPVVVRIDGPGGARPEPLGALQGVVLSAGAEFDVTLDVTCGNVNEVRALLMRADVELADLLERDGRYVLRNCQPEQLTAL